MSDRALDFLHRGILEAPSDGYLSLAEISRSDLSPRTALIAARHVAETLKQLHQHDVVYGGVDASNVLFPSRFEELDAEWIHFSLSTQGFDSSSRKTAAEDFQDLGALIHDCLASELQDSLRDGGALPLALKELAEDLCTRKYLYADDVIAALASIDRNRFKKEKVAKQDVLDCTIFCWSTRGGRLSVAGRQYSVDKFSIDETREELLAHSLDPERYGKILFDALLAPDGELRAGYEVSMILAQTRGQRLRIRLEIPAEWNDLHWERVYDSKRKIAWGRASGLSFSYHAGLAVDPPDALEGGLKVLTAVAAPSDAKDFGLAALQRDVLSKSFAQAAEQIESAASVEVLQGPVTPSRLREKLREGKYHVLHLTAHGVVPQGENSANLVLEDEGLQARFIDEKIFSEIFEGCRDLRLVVLMACHGGARRPNDPFAGLAASLVLRGVPAVVALRQATPIVVAKRFTESFYRDFARHGAPDVAVNFAREQLYLDAPDGSTWASPMLFLRMEDPALWGTSRNTEQMFDPWQRSSVQIPPGATFRSATDPAGPAGLRLKTGDPTLIDDYWKLSDLHPLIEDRAASEAAETSVSVRMISGAVLLDVIVSNVSSRPIILAEMEGRTVSSQALHPLSTGPGILPISGVYQFSLNIDNESQSLIMDPRLHVAPSESIRFLVAFSAEITGCDHFDFEFVVIVNGGRQGIQLGPFELNYGQLEENIRETFDELVRRLRKEPEDVETLVRLARMPFVRDRLEIYRRILRIDPSHEEAGIAYDRISQERKRLRPDLNPRFSFSSARDAVSRLLKKIFPR